MSRTKTMALPLGHLPQSISAPLSQSLLARYAQWLCRQRATNVERDHRLLLDEAVDHCDLEWRIRELDRRWTTGGIGGSRF